MLIRCPECQFEREINTANIPASATVATCPRCNARFRFREPGGKEIAVSREEAASRPEAAARPFPVSPESSAPSAPPAADPAAQAEESGRPRLPMEEENDDPLPPGAVIPNLDDAFPKIPSSDSEQEDPHAILPPQRPEAPPPPELKREAREDIPPKAEREQRAGAKAQAARADLRLGQEEPVRQDSSSPLAWREKDNDIVPWESSGQYSLPGGFFRTILQAMFRPQELFRAVGRDAPVIRGALFYVILNFFYVLMTRLWIAGPLRLMGEDAGSAEMQAMSQMVLESMSTPRLLILVPFFQLLWLFVLAAFFHVMIRLAQPDKADFNIVVRVLAYSASPYIFCIVPVLGNILAYFLYWVLCFVGCKFALGLSWNRTLLALAPLYIVGFALMLRFQMSFMSMF